MKNIQVFEHVLKVYLLKDIENKNALESIAKLIDKSLAKDPELYKFHETNQFKNYCFNSFYKLEADGIYREGRVYSVIIRTVDKKLSEYFLDNLADESTEEIKALTIDRRIIKRRHIEKIYSITPLILKTEKGYWRNSLSLKDFERLVVTNLIKKYNLCFDTKLDEDFEFFTMLEFDNKKPISTAYKNINLIGDKVTIYLAENDRAQELAYFSLGSGAGENNARGYGFLNFRGI